MISFVMGIYVGCVLYNDKDHRWWMNSYIEIMRKIVDVVSNHEGTFLLPWVNFNSSMGK